MEGSLDDLVHCLLDDIALCGEQGRLTSIFQSIIRCSSCSVGKLIPLYICQTFKNSPLPMNGCCPFDSSDYLIYLLGMTEAKCVTRGVDGRSSEILGRTCKQVLLVGRG